MWGLLRLTPIMDIFLDYDIGLFQPGTESHWCVTESYVNCDSVKCPCNSVPGWNEELLLSGLGGVPAINTVRLGGVPVIYYCLCWGESLLSVLGGVPVITTVHITVSSPHRWRPTSLTVTSSLSTSYNENSSQPFLQGTYHLRSLTLACLLQLWCTRMNPAKPDSPVAGR